MGLNNLAGNVKGGQYKHDPPIPTYLISFESPSSDSCLSYTSGATDISGDETDYSITFPRFCACEREEDDRSDTSNSSSLSMFHALHNVVDCAVENSVSSNEKDSLKGSNPGITMHYSANEKDENEEDDEYDKDIVTDTIRPESSIMNDNIPGCIITTSHVFHKVVDSAVGNSVSSNEKDSLKDSNAGIKIHCSSNENEKDIMDAKDNEDDKEAVTETIKSGPSIMKNNIPGCIITTSHAFHRAVDSAVENVVSSNMKDSLRDSNPGINMFCSLNENDKDTMNTKDDVDTVAGTIGLRPSIINNNIPGCIMMDAKDDEDAVTGTIRQGPSIMNNNMTGCMITTSNDKKGGETESLSSTWWPTFWPSDDNEDNEVSKDNENSNNDKITSTVNDDSSKNSFYNIETFLENVDLSKPHERKESKMSKLIKKAKCFKSPKSKRKDGPCEPMSEIGNLPKSKANKSVKTKLGKGQVERRMKSDKSDSKPKIITFTKEKLKYDADQNELKCEIGNITENDAEWVRNSTGENTDYAGILY